MLLLRLKGIAEKELTGTSLADDDYAYIRNIGDTLESLTTFSPEAASDLSTSDTERWPSSPTSTRIPTPGRCWKKAVGNPYHLLRHRPGGRRPDAHPGRGVQLLRVQAAHVRPPDRRGVAVHAGGRHRPGAAGVDKELHCLILLRAGPQFNTVIDQRGVNRLHGNQCDTGCQSPPAERSSLSGHDSPYFYT